MRKLIIKFLMWLLDMVTHSNNSSIVRHAKDEIDMFKNKVENKVIDEPDYYPFGLDSALNIIKAIAREHPSGFGIHYLLHLVKRLAFYECLTPLTGEDDEWGEVFDTTDGCRQNKRRSSVFKTADGNSYDIDAYCVDTTEIYKYDLKEHPNLMLSDVNGGSINPWRTFILRDGKWAGYYIKRANVIFPYTPSRLVLKGKEVIYGEESLFFVDEKELKLLKEEFIVPTHHIDSSDDDFTKDILENIDFSSYDVEE